MNILLHFGATFPSAEDVSAFRPIVERPSARLHVIYTQADPLSAGGQADINPAVMSDLHQGMEAEARQQLTAIFGHLADGATIQLRSGDPVRAIADYANDSKIDLIVIGLATHGAEEAALARGVLDATSCSLLVWRGR